MSIQTWKDEFYPVDQSEIGRSSKDAIDHSLLKWNGLTRDNLKKHNVRLLRPMMILTDSDANLVDVKSPEVFRVDQSTCVLCRINEHHCCTCPLYIAIGHQVCTLDQDTRNRGPYQLFRDIGDATRMIKALEEARSYLK